MLADARNSGPGSLGVYGFGQDTGVLGQAALGIGVVGPGADGGHSGVLGTGGNPGEVGVHGVGGMDSGPGVQWLRWPITERYRHQRPRRPRRAQRHGPRVWGIGGSGSATNPGSRSNPGRSLVLPVPLGSSAAMTKGLRGEVLEVLDVSFPLTVDAQGRDDFVTVTGTARWRYQREAAKVAGNDNCITLTQIVGPCDARDASSAVFRRAAALESSGFLVDTSCEGLVIPSGEVISRAVVAHVIPAAGFFRRSGASRRARSVC